MTDNLNPRQFFHGTTAELEEGAELLPGAKVKRGRGQSVWMTPSPEGAAGWAHTTAWKELVQERGAPDDDGLDAFGADASARARVYEVQPVEPAQDRNGYWKAPRATVVRRVEGQPEP